MKESDRIPPATLSARSPLVISPEQSSSVTIDDRAAGMQDHDSIGSRRDNRATTAMPAAGKSTVGLNAAFSASEYRPGRLEPGRNFLMDD